MDCNFARRFARVKEDVANLFQVSLLALFFFVGPLEVRGRSLVAYGYRRMTLGEANRLIYRVPRTVST